MPCKRSSMTKFGAVVSSLPKCKYFDEITFLHKKVVTGLVEEIYSCNQLSFHHLFRKFTKNSKKETQLPTQWVSSVVYVAEKGKLMWPRYSLWNTLLDTDNDIKKLLIKSKPGDYLHCKILMPVLGMLQLNKKWVAKN